MEDRRGRIVARGADQHFAVAGFRNRERNGHAAAR